MFNSAISKHTILSSRESGCELVLGRAIGRSPFWLQPCLSLSCNDFHCPIDRDPYSPCIAINPVVTFQDTLLVTLSLNAHQLLVHLLIHTSGSGPSSARVHRTLRT